MGLDERYSFLLTEKAKKTLCAIIRGEQVAAPFVLFEYGGNATRIGVSRCLTSNRHQLGFGVLPFSDENWRLCESWYASCGKEIMYSKESILPLDFLWAVDGYLVFGILGNQPCYTTTPLQNCRFYEDFFVDAMQRYLDIYFHHDHRKNKRARSSM